MAAEEFTGITLARIARPHGLRGEVAAVILTDFPERLPRLRQVWLWNGRSAARQMEVLKCRLTPGRGGHAIFLFSGVESREAAEALRGSEVQVPRHQRMKLTAGNYYVSDLVGCEVWEQGRDAPLGAVRDVQFPGGVPLLAVDAGEQEVLVPLAAEICLKIDPQGKRIDVSLPEGLLDLNRR